MDVAEPTELRVPQHVDLNAMLVLMPRTELQSAVKRRDSSYVERVRYCGEELVVARDRVARV
jgi:hypothetical protein